MKTVRMMDELWASVTAVADKMMNKLRIAVPDINKKTIEIIRLVVMVLNVVLMVFALVLQFMTRDAFMRHFIMCCFVMLFILITMFFDVILKDRKNARIPTIWFALWFFNAIITLFGF